MWRNSMNKRIFYTELSYVLGLVLLAIGTAFMTYADFGVSMVVAPAYLLHLKVAQYLPFFTFGMAEYTLQAVILVLMMILLKRFRVSYLFSFLTAVLYGLLLDCAMMIIGPPNAEAIWLRVIYYVVGLLICTCAVSMLFHTYISPEAYEIFVKEVSAKWRIDIHKFKTVYDCASCLIAIIMSFCFFGWWQFEGVKLGTVLCTLVNGYLIGLFSSLLEKYYEFRDGLKLRKFFE